MERDLQESLCFRFRAHLWPLQYIEAQCRPFLFRQFLNVFLLLLFAGVVVIGDAAGEDDHLIRLAVEQDPMVRVALQIRVERLYRVARPYRLPHRLRKTQIREQPLRLHDLFDQMGVRDSPFLGEFVELRLGFVLRFLGVGLAEIAADLGPILDPDGL